MTNKNKASCVDLAFSGFTLEDALDINERIRQLPTTRSYVDFKEHEGPVVTVHIECDREDLLVRYWVDLMAAFRIERVRRGIARLYDAERKFLASLGVKRDN